VLSLHVLPGIRICLCQGHKPPDSSTNCTFRFFIFMPPVFSIVLCTYNAEVYLNECIQSILNQTYANFELIVIDDGSSDGTMQYLENLTDQRLRLIRLDSNHGLIYARSLGFSEAKGRYIAIMDADDIADPRRLEEQLQAFQTKDIDVCGSFHISLDSANGKRRLRKSYVSDSDIRALLTIYCPLCNPSTSIKSEVVRRNGYNTDNSHAEDYGLWCDIAVGGGKFYNIAHPLLTYRLHAAQISKVKKADASLSFKKIQARYIERCTGQFVNPEAMPFRKRLRHGIAFLRTLNARIPGISFQANYEIYAEFQFRKNGWLTIPTRLERVAIAFYVTQYALKWT
jgi:glycosyltransferase involved in cell wall biosynthesis